jgi:hypothetical protein
METRRKRARVVAPAFAPPAPPRTRSQIHLTSFSARQLLLKPCVALGAQLATLVDNAALTTPTATAVHAALRSPFFSVVGAREGLPWSVNSLYAMMTARFLGCSSELDVVHTTVTMPASGTNAFPDYAVVMTACPDGATLLVATTHKLMLFDVATGALLRVVGDLGAGPLQFNLISDV